MVLSKSSYDESYFNPNATGIKYAWGYGEDYRTLFKNTIKYSENDLFPINSQLKKLYDKIKDQPFTNAKVLDIGGAIGFFSTIAKQLFPAIQYDVLDISTWCQTNKLPTVSNFILGDMVTLLQSKQQFKNNGYDLIISRQSLECLTDAELNIVIPELNRISAVKQIHIFSVPSLLNEATVSNNSYNAKTLQQWSLMGFESGTILMDISGNELVV